MLALAGGVVGAVLALWLTDALAARAVAGIPRLGEVRLDWATLAFTLALSSVAGVLFGVVPALHAARTDLHESLKQGGRGLSAGGARTRGALIAGAGGAVAHAAGGRRASCSRASPGSSRSTWASIRSTSSPPGSTLPSARYEKPEQQVAFFERLVEELRALPGVQRRRRDRLAAALGPAVGHPVLVRGPSGADAGRAAGHGRARRRARLLPRHGHRAQGRPPAGPRGRRGPAAERGGEPGLRGPVPAGRAGGGPAHRDAVGRHAARHDRRRGRGREAHRGRLGGEPDDLLAAGPVPLDVPQPRGSDLGRPHRRELGPRGAGARPRSRAGGGRREAARRLSRRRAGAPAVQHDAAGRLRGARPGAHRRGALRGDGLHGGPADPGARHPPGAGREP